MAFFSVIIPVYNSEKTIARLLESILKQSFKDYEVIIINDGSKDNSENVVLNYQDKFNDFHYILKKNGGVSSTRNVGLQKAEGEYILFADADDYFEEDSFLKIYDCIKNNNSSLVCFNYYNSFLNGEKTLGLTLKNIQLSMNSKKAITNFLNYQYINQLAGAIWNKAYRRDIIKKNKLEFSTDLLIGEDLLFNVEYFSCVNKVDILDEKLYNYVQSENSVMRSYRKNNVEHVKNYVPVLIGIFNKYNYQSYQEILFQFYISNFFGVISNEVLLKNYRQGKKNVNSYCKYALDKNVFSKQNMGHMNIKCKIYYLLIKSRLWQLVYFFIYLKNLV